MHRVELDRGITTRSGFRRVWRCVWDSPFFITITAASQTNKQKPCLATATLSPVPFSKCSSIHSAAFCPQLNPWCKSSNPIFFAACPSQLSHYSPLPKCKSLSNATKLCLRSFMNLRVVSGWCLCIFAHNLPEDFCTYSYKLLGVFHLGSFYCILVSKRCCATSVYYLLSPPLLLVQPKALWQWWDSHFPCIRSKYSSPFHVHPQVNRHKVLNADVIKQLHISRPLLPGFFILLQIRFVERYIKPTCRLRGFKKWNKCSQDCVKPAAMLSS